MTYVLHDPDLEAAAQRAAHRLSPEAWAACRRDYEDGVPVIVLAERYSVGERHVRRKSSEEGWERLDRRARTVLACLENDRTLPVPRGRASDETLELLHEATRDENMTLLMRPDADGLSGYAFRRAAEEATRGAPHQVLAWLRVVHAIDRSAASLQRQSRSHSVGDALRASILHDVERELARAREGDVDDDDPERPE